MDYSEQKMFFETAYRTGTDLWTDKHYRREIFRHLAAIPENALVLDLGSGRGRWAVTMAEMGLRVIGLDYIKELADVGNKEAKAKHLDGRIRFVHGDALDIGFADESFDAVTDFELLQHLSSADWPRYADEVARVVKPGGLYLALTLSKETEHFYEFSPKHAKESDFEKYGVTYHFFDPGEVERVMGSRFRTVTMETIFIEREKEYLLLTILQKI